MKKIDANDLSLITAGSNRQCLIDGGLTVIAIVIGTALGGVLGGGAALIGGLYAGNANGCF